MYPLLGALLLFAPSVSHSGHNIYKAKKVSKFFPA